MTLSWEGSLSVKAMGGTAAEKWTLTESRLNEKSQIHYKADVRKYKGTELCGRIPNLAPEMCLYFDVRLRHHHGRICCNNSFSSHEHRLLPPMLLVPHQEASIVL